MNWKELAHDIDYWIRNIESPESISNRTSYVYRKETRFTTKTEVASGIVEDTDHPSHYFADWEHVNQGPSCKLCIQLASRSF